MWTMLGCGRRRQARRLTTRGWRGRSSRTADPWWWPWGWGCSTSPQTRPSASLWAEKTGMRRKKEPNGEEEEEEESLTFVQVSQSAGENLVGWGLSSERVSDYHEAVTHQHHLVHLNQSHVTVRDFTVQRQLFYCVWQHHNKIILFFVTSSSWTHHIFLWVTPS